MKISLSILTLICIFTGCSNDISKLSKKECIQEGYIYKVQTRLNYRMGEYETRSVCLKKTS